jgi:hypothetical protein
MQFFFVVEKPKQQFTYIYFIDNFLPGKMASEKSVKVKVHCNNETPFVKKKIAPFYPFFFQNKTKLIV